jgi:hypothetical protein
MRRTAGVWSVHPVKRESRLRPVPTPRLGWSTILSASEGSARAMQEEEEAWPGACSRNAPKPASSNYSAVWVWR